MTLLQSVNRVLLDLREDSVDALTSEDQVQSIVDALNLAAAYVLRSHEWSFLVRTDGLIFLPGRFTATTGGVVTNGTTAIQINNGSGNSWSSSTAAPFTGSVRARIRFTDDAAVGNTSSRIDTINITANYPATLENVFRGTTVSDGSAPLEVYAHEYVLPSTVRSVLSMRVEERPIQLNAPGDRFADFDRAIPRHTVSFTNHPHVAYVGGYLQGTQLASTSPQSGMGAFFWPIPDDDVQVHYSYVYQHAELSDDSDEWTGVEYEVVRLIERMAFASELIDNRQADTARGVALKRENEDVMKRLQDADLDRQGRDRKVMMPFDRVGFTGDPWSRWTDRTPSV